jgi:hypothetical protein
MPHIFSNHARQERNSKADPFEIPLAADLATANPGLLDRCHPKRAHLVSSSNSEIQRCYGDDTPST